MEGRYAAGRGVEVGGAPARALVWEDGAAGVLSTGDPDVFRQEVELSPRMVHVPVFAGDRIAIVTHKLRTPTDERAPPRRGSDPTPITSRRKGGAKSPKTINNLLTILRSILNLAHDYELIDRVPRIKMEVIKRQDAGFLDDREVEAFLRAAPPEWRTFLLTAIRTGLRRGELLELRWRDLHLDAPRPFVRVSRALRRTDKGGWAVKETKGGRPRSVPLSGEVIAALEQHRRDAGPHDLVFPGESGGYINRNKLWRMVVKTARAGGLDKHVHPHLLRHTFASHCYQRGIPPQVVQQWLGHASIATTERYAHLAPNTGAELIDLLDATCAGRRPDHPREARA